MVVKEVGKPIRFGSKFGDSQGFTRRLKPYCGASTNIEQFGLGQGPDVVLGLCKMANLHPGTKVYFDKLLMSKLDQGGTGTM